MEVVDIGFVSYVAAFLVLLTVLVFIHEWGHFAVARFFGVRVRVFSIGFGPEIFGWYDKKGTRWKISSIPLGGYVMFFGDAGVASNPDSEAAESMSAEDRAVSFHHQSLPKKAAIIAAGPLINFAFAILIYAGLFMTIGQSYSPAVVASVSEQSAAMEAGLLPDDLIISINQQEVDRFEDLSAIINMSMGETLDVLIQRQDEQIVIPVTPRKEEIKDRFGGTYEVWRIGVGRQIDVIVRGPASALYHASLHTARMSRMMLTGIGQVILGVRSVKDMGGPLKIAQMAGEQASLGFVSFIWLMAIISINLGLVNLFPIPMLDGGHLMFYGMEAVRGKPVSPKVQEIGYLVGLTLVLGLMVLLTWNDLNSFNVLDSINRLFS